MTPRFFQAKFEDIDRIEDCARRCCEEHGRELCGELNWDHYRFFWTELMLARLGTMFLYEVGGEVVGGIGGAKHPEAITGKWRCSQVFIYIRPEWRGKLSVFRLMRTLERWAKSQGCSEVTAPLLSDMPKGTESAYRRMGYRSLQTLFVKGLA